MNKSDQVLSIIKKLKENKPAKVFKKVSDDLDSGVRFVLLYLTDNKGEVYASSISEAMNISRARVGILLNKMEDKGYISKKASYKDARIEVVNLTDKGLKRCNEIKDEIAKYISIIVDKVGFNELNHFLDTACKIKNVLKEGGYID